MQGTLISAFDEAFVRQILKMIQDGDPKNLVGFLDMQLSSQLIPDWYKNEVISRVYFRIKDEYKTAKTRAARERFLLAIELMNDKYGSALVRK